MNIKISACTIVKNEEKNIERWLAGVRSFADEIIIIDTGSTDNTVALAKAGRAVVKHFPWRNDFSAAKNFAIEQAHGDWIVMLDADEYFDENSQKKMRQIMSYPTSPHTSLLLGAFPLPTRRVGPIL
jgi:glycosyltransferase involved in cell wall biosynthesis